MRALASAAALLAAAAIGPGCTVDQLLGLTQSPADGGVCAAQTCTPGCGPLDDCMVRNDSPSYGFNCEAAQVCAPGCTPDGPCELVCDKIGERVDCAVHCAPAQTCTVLCREGACSAVCGASRPATACDGGTFTCGPACP